MKGKLTSKKKILIAASLLGIFLIGAIVSIVLVLAASAQGVTSNITVSYNAEGVAAKVSANYAIVPLDTSATVTKTAMTTSGGGQEITFNLSTAQSRETIAPDAVIELDTQKQTVVFEYVFENLAETAFSLSLTQRPTGINMTEAFYVSGLALDPSDYASVITNTEMPAQAVTYIRQKVYIYILASVTNENRTASYNGAYVWELKAQNKAEYSVTLNNGTGSTGGMTTLPVISTSTVSGIMMPAISDIPSQIGKIFAGYYSATDGTGTQYYDGNGMPLTTAVTSAMTLYAHYTDLYTIENTAEGTVVTNLGDAAAYVATTSGTSFTYGSQTYTTNGEYLMLEPDQSLTLTSTTALAYADGLTVSMEQPSDLASKKFYAAYGAYPQTYVGASLNSTLTSATLTATGKIYSTEKEGTATTLTEYEYNGVKYAKLTNSKAYSTNYTFSTGETVADGQIYFFIVEPIVVKAMEVDDAGAKVMTVNLLGSKRFDGDANDWETSELRTYLNGTFLTESGLSGVAQAITIKNNVTANYIDGSGTSTEDTIWLPSVEEIFTWTGTQMTDSVIESLETDSYYLDSNGTLRKLKPSDIAMVTYSYYSNTHNAGYYFLRSAGIDSGFVCCVTDVGGVYTDGHYYGGNCCFAAAFYIAFEDYTINQDSSSGTTVSMVKNYSKDNLYVEVASGTEFSYGSAKYTTSGEYLMLEAGQSIAITAQVPDSAILTKKPSDLASKKFYAAYGAYPQTYVGASLSTTLTNASLTATGKSYTTDINNTATTLAEYEYNGVKYAKLTSSKAYSTNYTFSTGETVADGQIYFFIVEPIVVKAMEVDDAGAKVMTVNLLGSKRFDGDANDWETSELRTYLNGTFLTESGLSGVAQAITIKNNVTGNYSSSTSDGSGADTEDTIWLASYYEMNTKWGLDNTSRKRKPSDMALATYSYYNKTNDAGYYFLRSLGLDNHYVCDVGNSGNVYANSTYYYSYSGFCPAFYINL